MNLEQGYTSHCNATFSVQNNTGEVIQFDLGLNSKDAFEFASEAAKGLSRLGSSGSTEAIDVLNASLGHADEEITSYIVGALLKALNTTTDETLKSQIRHHFEP